MITMMMMMIMMMMDSQYRNEKKEGNCLILYIYTVPVLASKQLLFCNKMGI